MRRLLILLLVPFCLFAQDVEEEQWYELEKEVQFEPWSEKRIDSIRAEYGVTKLEKGRTVECTLPRRCKSVYKINWGAANAGYAIIEDKRNDEHFTISGKMVTNKFISAFYRVRDYVYTVGDANGLYPHFFEQHIEEKDYRKKRWTLYDHSQEKLFKMNGSDLTEDSITPYLQNYMSILYNIRNSEFIEGDTLYFPTYVHGENYNIAIVVHERERVRVPAGKYDCIKVQPILVGEDGHGFNAKDEMFIWFTDDDRKLFVKGKVKIKLGHIYAKLHYLEVDK